MSGQEYHRRTAITRLKLRESGDAALLLKTIDEWRDATNLASELAWNQCHTKNEILALARDKIQDETGLGSQHAILACHTVSAAITSCIERRKKEKKASKPRFTSRSITFDRRTLSVFPGQEKVSLTTFGDHSRIHADLALPDDNSGYQYQFLDSDDWEYTESTLHYRDGNFYLHLGYRKPMEREAEPATGNGTVLGVDFGVNQIAVTSTARFFSAAELNHTRREFEKTRGELQQTGTQSAHRTIQEMSGREDRYVKHVLHNVANGIIEEAVVHDCDGIILEDLTGIRDRLRDAEWHAEWAFRKLKEYVVYKAEAEGVFVDTVNPVNTSKRCPECGHVSEENRRRDTFACVRCENRNHADYNAAKNIAELYLLRGHQAPGGRSVSQYALTSGPRTPS